MARIRKITGQQTLELVAWELSVTPSGACANPAEATRLTDWIPAVAPGTTAQALEAVGLWRRGAPEPLWDKDVWWRTALPGQGARRLCLDGLATLAEAWLDDLPVLQSCSMFRPRELGVDVGPDATLWICFRALSGALVAKGLRARWRPRMIEPQGLRLVRTTLLGHMPGWCPPVDVVGPWRPVRLVDEGPLRARDVSLRPSWRDGEGRLEASLRLEGAGPEASPMLHCAGFVAALEPQGEGRFAGVLRLPAVAPWWPHTHGEPALHQATLVVGEAEIDLGRTGFRCVKVDRGGDGRGFGLRVNGEPVFCRGACWVNPDPVRLGGARSDYEPALRLAREAGMNMVRVSGVGVYESSAFFDLCDELGLLVWQDFMFANFDYPAADPAFAAEVKSEAEAFLQAVETSPSLAVLCGGSEVMQQAAMMGLAPDELAWPLFDEILPQAASRWRPDVAYAPNTPCGGAVPFVADKGVTHYYGVGAYERPLEDARRVGVRFAAECLAFANVPCAETLAQLAAPAVHDPRWKARTPRDRGASWDFEDVRDHYFERRFALDPYRLRREDPDLYLDLSRVVTGEVMSAVFDEWRRMRSPCAGGLIWTLRDLDFGAGWGLIDAAGEPKPAWWALKRALQPVQVALTDEGGDGLAIHLTNERPDPLRAELRLAVFGEGPGALLEVRRPVELPLRGRIELSGFELIGRFFDFTYAYRFGPRTHAAVSAQLLAGGGGLLSQAVYLPPGVRGWEAEDELSAGVFPDGDGWRLQITGQRLQRFVHIRDPGFRPDDDWFPLLPGEPRDIRLSARDGTASGVAPCGQILIAGGRDVGRY